MPYTVWGAFDAFRKNTADLNAEDTKVARASRDFLTGQLGRLAQLDSSFPRLQGKYMPFGSFARRTKIRPLDDIDMLILLIGGGTSACQSNSDSYTYWLRVENGSSSLAAFPDNFGYVNSTKILNKVCASLSSVSQYGKAEIKKTMQAVTLNLISYSWSFDIVPAVPISDGNDGVAYYLIPNGRGDWIRTDPRIDEARITTQNRQHNGNLLPVVRLLKYWNNRRHKPRLSSYYFETLVLKVFANAPTITDFPTAVKYFFDRCYIYLMTTCPDPKNLGAALDSSVSYETKQKVADALNDAATFAGYAMMYEQQSNDKDAIYWWGRVFGSEFPAYG